LISAHVPDNTAIVFDGQETTARVMALEINRLRNASKIGELPGWDGIQSSPQSSKTTDFDILEQLLQNLELKPFVSNDTFRFTCQINRIPRVSKSLWQNFQSCDENW
jgi:hypothetical protein